MDDVEGIKKSLSSKPEKKPARVPRRKFYHITYKPYARAYGMKFINKSEVFAGGYPIIITPPFDKRGFRTYPVTPRFHLSKKFGRTPCDIEEFGEYWLVSDCAKKVLEQISGSDFCFMALDVDVDKGQVPAKYWLCEIIKVEDVVDIDKSEVKIARNDRDEEYIVKNLSMKIAFKEKLINDCRIFRLCNNQSIIICDDKFKNKIKAASLTGLSFEDVTPRKTVNL